MPGAALPAAVSVGEAGLVVHGEHLLQSAQVGSGSLVQAQVVPCSHGHNLLEREERCEAGWYVLGGSGGKGGQRTQRGVCSVRPGATYEQVWRDSPTAAPQRSPGDRPCAHGWAPRTQLTLLSTACTHLPERWHETTPHPALHPPAHLSNPGNGAHGFAGREGQGRSSNKGCC